MSGSASSWENSWATDGKVDKRVSRTEPLHNKPLFWSFPSSNKAPSPSAGTHPSRDPPQEIQ